MTFSVGFKTQGTLQNKEWTLMYANFKKLFLRPGYPEVKLQKNLIILHMYETTSLKWVEEKVLT